MSGAMLSLLSSGPVSSGGVLGDNASARTTSRISPSTSIVTTTAWVDFSGFVTASSSTPYSLLRPESPIILFWLGSRLDSRELHRGHYAQLQNHRRLCCPDGRMLRS